jgi:hypothetical protein
MVGIQRYSHALRTEWFGWEYPPKGEAVMDCGQRPRVCGLAIIAILLALPWPLQAQTDSLPVIDSKTETGPAAKQDELLPSPAPAIDESRQPMAPPESPLSSPFSPGPLVGPVGHVPYRADYRLTWFADEPVRGQSTNLGYTQHDFSLAFPLWQGCADEFSASVHVRGEIFHTGAVLPDTGQPFPDELWNIRFGTTYRHQFDNGWITGGTVSVGSASDKPFHSIDEMTAGINAFLRVPQGEHNAWLFSLNYSPTSELPFPIPGVAYVYQPSEYFRATIGLPFQIMYRPWDDLTLEASYMLLRTVHAKATYRLCDWLRVFAAFDWANESYFLADRVNVNDRFFYYDKRVSGGVKAYPAKHVELDLSAGYTFDRFYFEGAQFSDSDHNRVGVGNGPFVSLQGQIRW